jgi:uncharacterized coiled-coil DUF342 family protein
MIRADCPFPTVDSALILLSACGPSKEQELQSRVDELEDQVETLQTQLQEAHRAADDVRDNAERLTQASDELEASVGRLSDENWREVVPDVEGASSDVDDAQEALKASVDDLPDD